MTLRFALLGNPVGHSISPRIHRAAFAALELDAEYFAKRVSAGAVARSMRDPRLTGGNVTLPHKILAAKLLDRPEPAVGATGACNCWWRLEDGALAGDNTDVGGLRFALGQLGFEARGARVLLLGAGGAARAALYVLLEGEADSVEILNRSADRARALRAKVGARIVRVREGLDGAPATRPPPATGAPARVVRVLEGLDGVDGGYDLVLNATSVGLSPQDPLPLPLSAGRFGCAFDMVYAPGGTRWSARARSLGIPARDGIDMLVGQAAESLARWLPGREPPLRAMRAAAREALRGEGRRAAGRDSDAARQ